MHQQIDQLLRERRRIAEERCTAAGLAYIESIWPPDADTWPPDAAERVALACCGAARELLRTGALADLGVTEPHEVAGVTATASLAQGTWLVIYDWSDTALADPGVLWRALRWARGPGETAP